MLKWLTRSTYDQGVQDTFEFIKGSVPTESLRSLLTEILDLCTGDDRHALAELIAIELDRRNDELSHYKEGARYYDRGRMGDPSDPTEN